MAKFLDTSGVTYYLMELIKNTETRLMLISPYLKLNDRIKSSLKDLDLLKKDIRIVYGKKEILLEEMKWIKDVKSIHISFIKNLHAKCYLNENEAIITSMNLYQFSQENNNEMGVYVKKSEDESLYSDIKKEADRLLRESVDDGLEVTETKKPKKSINKSKSSIKDVSPGFCIRCSNHIKLNPMVPYCSSCFKSWKKYENDEYTETFCHVCGKDHPAIMIKPNCYPCFKKYKNKLKFPGV
jgi:phosphatidylserine/phosphatidylglycerophosphate/cardiolipin synthase-like enzyme